MQPQYIFYNPEGKWLERGKLLDETFALMTETFASEWQVGSVWDCLDTMKRAWGFFNPAQADSDIVQAFQAAMLDQIDYDKWQTLKDRLFSIQSLIGKGTQPQSMEVENKNWLGLTEKGVLAFKEKYGSLGAEKLQELMEKLTESYQNFSDSFKPIAAALAYYHPLSHRIDLVESLEKSIRLLEGTDLEKTRERELWEGVMRFLGQSFFSYDTRARDWVLNFLTSAPLDEQIFESEHVTSFLLICFFISARDFKDLAEEDRTAMLNILCWWQISFGVPIRCLLEEDLALQPNVLHYEFYSGLYARLISENNAIIFFGTKEIITVRKFFQDYFIYAGNNDLDGFKQMNYVDEKIKMYSWPIQIKNRLLELLNIYLHLREMDLVDYRAILSDSGIIPSPYDWEKVLLADLSEEDQVKIKRHFSLLMMPTKLKIELVAAFQSLSWKEEPYLSRVLVLSDLYQDIYNSPYSPLVYFDETEGDWVVNKELPEEWIKFSFAYDYKKLIDKKMGQSLENEKLEKEKTEKADKQ